MGVRNSSATGRWRRPREWYTLPLLVWMGVILYGTLAPASGLPSVAFDLWDKLTHALMYAPFAFLLLRAWVRSGPIPVREALIVLVIAMAWGYYLECIQALTPDRDYDLMDALADTVGSVIGIAALAALRLTIGWAISAGGEDAGGTEQLEEARP